MAIALPYQVLAQHVPAGGFACQLQPGGHSCLTLDGMAAGATAVLGTACVRFDTGLSGCVAFRPQPACVVPNTCQLSGHWVPLEPHSQLHHATSAVGRKRAAECHLLHPMPPKQRCTSPHLASPAACRQAVQPRPSEPNACTPQWAALSPAHTMLGPADCSSASCPTAATSRPLPQQPDRPQAWSTSPCHLALLPYPHPSPAHPTHCNPTTSQPHLASRCMPHYACAPGLPHDPHRPLEAASHGHNSRLWLTPPQGSTHTTATTIMWPSAACDPQPSYWGPSPAPQQPLWEPSPSSASTCSAASSWLPAPPSSISLHPIQPQQPQHQQQHQPQLLRPVDEGATILCHLTTTVSRLQPQPLVRLPQLPACQLHSVPVPHMAAAAAQPAALPPSVAWYSDTNSPAALLEANDFMATICLPGGVEYLQVPAGSAMHRLGVLCHVSAASICLAQSYYLRLRHCMPLLQSALRLLSSLPGAATATAQRRAVSPSPARSHAEAVITGVKFTCVALAAKMLEARSGQQKQLRGLLAHLTSSAVASNDALAIEVRVLQHLDWRLGPYFLPPDSANGNWH